jgi:hypothetical protein
MVALTVSAQNHNDTIIYWDKDSPLEWPDFEGEPDKNNPLYAETYYELHLKPLYKNGTYKYKVINRFITTKSWKKDTSKALLAHEQLHFDIAELYARKMREKITRIESSNETDPDKIIDVFQDQFKAMTNYQQQYDKDTNHGLKTKEQQQWERKVKNQLATTRKFEVDYEALVKQVIHE